MQTTTDSKHYQLNAKQLHYLKLIYKFRFITTTLLSQYKQKQETTTTYLALKNLNEQGYIGRHYEKGYKLRGQAASYYLLPKGMTTLKAHGIGTTRAYNSIYKDKTATEQFIAHCLALFEAHNRLRQLYGERLSYHSKSELTPSTYDYFPSKRPDAYITLAIKSYVEPKEFFLEYFEDAKPIIMHIGRVRQYIKYAASNKWDDSGTLPTILLVCETPAVERGIHRRLLKLRNSLRMYTTTRNRLIESKEARAWCTAEDPKTMLALDELS